MGEHVGFGPGSKSTSTWTVDSPKYCGVVTPALCTLSHSPRAARDITGTETLQRAGLQALSAMALPQEGTSRPSVRMTWDPGHRSCE